MEPSATRLIVTVEGGDIIVALPKSGFRAVYYEPSDQPHLILRSRTATDDHELLARAWQAVNTTARELGWIVSRWRLDQFVLAAKHLPDGRAKPSAPQLLASVGVDQHSRL